MRPIGNSPLESTTLRLEQAKSFSFSVQLMEEGRAPIDTTDCTIRLDFNDQTIVAAYEGDGRSRLDIQASHVQHTGSYPYSVTLIAHSGYSTTIMKGSLDVLPNADQNIETYSATTPPTGVEVFLRGQQVVQIAAAPQLPPELSGARAARIDGRGHLILTLDNGNELDVGLVKGEKGDQGLPAPPVKQLYTWTKYADTPTSGMSNSPDGKVYRGQAFNKESPDESNNYADYTWERIQGPPGPPGVDGSPGIPGADGFDGTTLYTWLKYADTPTSGMSDDPAGKPYMGLAYNQVNPVESNDYEDYYWSLIEGPAGRPGDDGQMLYTWVRYATGPNGEGMSNLPDGKVYIGLAFNKDTLVESENPADYTWSLFRGAEGTSISSLTPYFRAVAKGAPAPALPTGNPPANWQTTEPDFDLMKNLYRSDQIIYSNGIVAYTPVTRVQGNFGAVYVAGMVQASTHVGAKPPTEPGSPFEGQMWWVTNPANDFAGLRRYNGSSWQNYRLMANDIIAANSISAPLMQVGSVKAEALDVESVDPDTGGRLSIQPDGVRGWAPNKTGEPTFALLSSKSDTFELYDTEDNKVVGMDDSGSVVGSRVVANDELIVGGRDVVSEINDVGGKLIGFARWDVGAVHIEKGTWFIWGELNFTIKAGHYALVFVSGPRVSYGPVTTSTYVTNAVAPATPPLPSTAGWGDINLKLFTSNSGSSEGGSQYYGKDSGFTIYGGYAEDRNFRLLFVSTPRTDASAQVQQQLLAYVTDIGIIERSYSSRFIGQMGGSPPTTPIVQTYEKTYTSTTWQTYASNGAVASSFYNSNGRVAQGTYSPNANLRSLYIFPDMMSDLSGATILDAQLYVKNSHTYWNAGGTARIYSHAHTSLPGSLGALSSDPITAYFSKGEGKWISIPTSHYPRLISGAIRGYGFYSTSTGDYGYFAPGAKIWIRYQK